LHKRPTGGILGLVPNPQYRSMTASRKKLFVKTFGCQMNVYDSGRMADALGPAGFERTETPDDADLIILNTCHIREKAVEKVYSEVGRLRAVKQARGRGGMDTLIAVAGCVAQAEGEEIVRRAPAVDLVFGPQAYHRLPELVGRAGRGETVIDTDFPAEDKFDHCPVQPPSASAQPDRRVPHRSGRVRQVLHLLRGALYARRRSLAAGVGHSGRGAGVGRGRRARDHASRTERQCLAWRGAGRRNLGARAAPARPGRNRWPDAAAIHDQSPLRHG
jgi:hypothetical protein